jgi:uncharacterized protein YecE (DUF72 family)
MAEIRVGISGWMYPLWRGNFYPRGLPQKLELAYASRRFNALEINGTFYSLQRPSTFDAWYEATPPAFVFALKGGRFLTHMRKLRRPLEPLANYLASGVLRLREKLGPILWQFPPNMSLNEDRFKAFFNLLPHDTVELARVAKHHSAKLKSRVCPEPDAKRPVRHAIIRTSSCGRRWMYDGWQESLASIPAGRSIKFSPIWAQRRRPQNCGRREAFNWPPS